MVFKKIIFQNSLMANETPSRPPPPFMAKAILNFHFDYLHTSLIWANKLVNTRVVDAAFKRIRRHNTMGNIRQVCFDSLPPIWFCLFNETDVNCVGTFSTESFINDHQRLLEHLAQSPISTNYIFGSNISNISLSYVREYKREGYRICKKLLLQFLCEHIN